MDQVLNIKYKVSGKVIHGDHFGRDLGFPTANLDRRDYNRQKLKIKFGIWAGTAVEVRGKSLEVRVYKAAIVIGPIDKRGLPKIEAYLLDFTGDLYAKKLKLLLINYIRPFKKYKNIPDLKKQISEDVEKVRKITAD